MRSVLILSQSIPRFPGPGAETRAYCLARALSKQFKLTFMVPAQTPEAKAVLARLNDLGQTIGLERQWTRISWRTQQLKQLFEGMQRYNPLARRPEMVRAIEPILPAMQAALSSLNWEAYDLIHVIHPHVACVLEGIAVAKPKTLDWVDERTNVLERSLTLRDSERDRWATRVEINRVRAYQKRIGPLFEATFASSALDVDRLASQVKGSQPLIVPNGVDTAYFDQRDEFGGRRAGQLLFSGHMGYEPNIDAVQYFWREIWPIIQRKLPESRLMVVGTSPSDDIRRLGREHPDQVTVTGQVEDMRPYLAQASVCLAPLRSGSGTRLKILEAMAMGRPVVSTSLGCEGLDVRDGQDILIGDTSEAFAAAVVRLLEDEVSWRRVSHNGRRLVVEKYGWDQAAEPMARVWRELTG